MAAVRPIFEISPAILSQLRTFARPPPPINMVSDSEDGNCTLPGVNCHSDGKYSHIISNILLDICVVNDVCKNLHSRVLELECLIGSNNDKISNFTDRSEFCANSIPPNFQDTSSGKEEDGRDWFLVPERRKHRLPPTNIPPPPLLPTRNAFDVLAAYNDGEFPSLQSAAATRFQPNHLNRAPPQAQRPQPTRQSRQASIPTPPFTLNTAARTTRKVFPPNQLTFKETECHVLDAPAGYAKAHSVDQTLQMSAGIAVDFKNEIGQVQELKSQNKIVGEVAHVTKLDLKRKQSAMNNHAIFSVNIRIPNT